MIKESYNDWARGPPDHTQPKGAVADATPSPFDNYLHAMKLGYKLIGSYNLIG